VQSYDQLLPALKRRLPSRSLALLGRQVSFIKRLRAIRASFFVWAVVLSRFGEGIPGFAEAQAWYARLGGKRVWPRPFQKRFLSKASVALFERAFDSAVAPWRDAPARKVRHVLARHFTDIVAWDTTRAQVADSLKKTFKGTRSAEAVLKIGLAISVFGRLPLYGLLCADNVHDMLLFPPLSLFEAGTLLLFDKGMAAYERLGEVAAARLLYLCPMRANGNPLVVAAHEAPRRVHAALRKHPKGVPLRDLLPKGQRLSQTWDLEVLVTPKTTAANKTPVRTRLVIMQGPKRQHPYLTNLPVTWKAQAIRELYRLRWQVELVFKELKQHLNLESLPSEDEHAVQIFAWASLIALALSREVCAWVQPLRRVVGLAERIRPALVTRALRGTVRLLVACLRAPLRTARRFLEVLREELLREARSAEPDREDSFQRLSDLLAANAPA